MVPLVEGLLAGLADDSLLADMILFLVLQQPLCDRTLRICSSRIADSGTAISNDFQSKAEMKYEFQIEEGISEYKKIAHCWAFAQKTAQALKKLIRQLDKF